MQQVYGLALPARMQIEAQIVNKYALVCSLLCVRCSFALNPRTLCPQSARVCYESQICRTRLGLPSSRLALDTLLGRLDEVSPETYLGLPEHSIDMVDYREVIEQQRGIQLMPKRF
jgi:hypothetical protein